jgi:hypothetical protein
LEKVAEDLVYHSIDEKPSREVPERSSLDLPEKVEEEAEDFAEPLTDDEEQPTEIGSPVAKLTIEPATARDLPLVAHEPVAKPEPRPTVLRRKKPPPPEPLRLKDLKGEKLKALLEAREVLDDAHLLCAQQSGEVRTERILKQRAERSITVPGKSEMSKVSTDKSTEKSIATKPSPVRKKPPEPPNWNWEEWKTWSMYSKVWTHHWKNGGEVPIPEAPYDTHWLANPYIGHSPYQPWMNKLQPPHKRGVRKAASAPGLKIRPRTEMMEISKPVSGLENYDKKVRKLLKSSAKKAARHYISGMLEDKMRMVLAAMDRPEVDPNATWSYGDEYADFQRTMELTEQLVQRTAKRKPQTVDPGLLRFTDDNAPDVPLFSHFVPEPMEVDGN